MNYFLALLVIVAAMVVSCQGQCTAPYLVPDISGKLPTSCTIDGIYMTLGTTITKNCQTYFCDKDGGSYMCGVGMHIVEHPADCKVVPGEDGCGEKAVKIDDESIECIKGVAAVSKRDIK